MGDEDVGDAAAPDEQAWRFGVLAARSEWAGAARVRAVGLAAQLAVRIHRDLLLPGAGRVGREAFPRQKLRCRGRGDAGTRAGRLFSRGPCAAGAGRRPREAWSVDHDHHGDAVPDARRCGRPVARARGEASAFGARFDVETDAAMLAVLSVAVAALGIAGWWVLAIGALRYAYVATSLFVAALRTPLPYRYSGKVIAVAQAVALLAALTQTDGEHWVPTAFLLAALAALCWSFGRSVIWQLRHS